MIVNLTQHTATPEQIAQGVVDLPPEVRESVSALLTVTSLSYRNEIVDRCADIAELAVSNGLGGDDADDPHPDAAMIGGAPWLMTELERALQAVNIKPVYAFSVRESIGLHLLDGSVRKVNVFRHEGFIDAIC